MRNYRRRLEQSIHEAEFQRRVGEHYEHSGGSASVESGTREFLRRTALHRKRPRPQSKEFDASRAKALVQTRIDTS
jgi:hypothetical protein